MKKIVGIIVGVVLLLVVVGGVILYFSLNSIVHRQIETQGTAATGVDTQLDGVDLSPFSGALGLDRFVLANPQGFSEQPVFSFDDAQVKVRIGSLIGGGEIVVPRLHLDGATVIVELSGKNINIQQLLENIQERSDPAPEQDPQDARDKAPGKAVLINDLRITNTKVIGSLELVPDQPPLKVDFALADIVKTDVRQATLADAIGFAVQTVMINASRGLAEVAPDLDAFVGGLEDSAGQSIDEAAGRIDQVVPGAGKELGDKAKDEVNKALGDLLGDDKKDE